jgi:hypothetical protein
MENRWTEEDFVQLARPKTMPAANPNALPHLLFEFFSEALLHCDDAARIPWINRLVIRSGFQS